MLDVGCGPGTITVGPGRPGARRPGDRHRRGGRRAGAGPAGGGPAGQANVRFEVGDVYHLGYDDGTFDVVHAHQVLQHLSDPVAALTEMRRVCRPGGLVAARDGDYGGFFWFPDDPGLTEWQALYRNVARALGGEPDAGRRLLSWAGRPASPRSRPRPAPGVTPGREDRPWWGNSWAERLTESPFGDRAVEHGLATRQDLARLAEGWRRWAASEDGWFLIPHGEILCEVPA